MEQTITQSGALFLAFRRLFENWPPLSHKNPQVGTPLVRGRDREALFFPIKNPPPGAKSIRIRLYDAQRPARFFVRTENGIASYVATVDRSKLRLIKVIFRSTPGPASEVVRRSV